MGSEKLLNNISEKTIQSDVERYFQSKTQEILPKRCLRSRNRITLAGKVAGNDDEENVQCPDGFQCVDAIENLYGQNTEYGVCIPCNSSQYCPRGSIGSLRHLNEYHLCPRGHLCSPTLHQCEAGYICKDNERLSCAEIQNKYRTITNYGNIFGGTYCPNGSAGMIICKPGSYCPDTTSKPLACPKGYYCPAMTSDYRIYRCDSCPQGSNKFKPSKVSIISVSLAYIMFIALIWIVIKFSMRLVLYKRKAYRKNSSTYLTETECSSTNRSEITSDFQDKIEKEHIHAQKYLYAISQNILKNIDYFPNDSKKNFSDPDNFDTVKFFEVLIPSGSDSMTIQQLNMVLGLTESERYHFMAILSRLSATVINPGSILRSTLEEHFLTVLDLLHHFNPTSEDASKIFDLLDENCGGLLCMTSLHHPYLEKFLDDSQIQHVILECNERRKKPNLMFNLNEALRDGLDEELGPKDEDYYDVINHRFNNACADSSIDYVEHCSKEFLMSKEEFIHLYPQVLKKVTSPWYTVIDYKEKSSSSPSARKNAINFEDLSVIVGRGTKRKLVLDNLSGKIELGVMTAVMGASGAGKTTLLNALSGRLKEGIMKGKVHARRPEKCTIQDVFGFVPQDDVLYEELTVQENLLYAGRFRLPSSTTSEELHIYVEEIMRKLGLLFVADSIVGGVEKRGLSGGERKRTSIAMELMGRPSIIFLDEPSSGLDSMSALIVMQAIKKLVNEEEITAVASIHQPRQAVFYTFDKLCLLGIGGKLIYNGDVNQVENYFGNINFFRPQEDNVADWVIDISAGIYNKNNSSKEGCDGTTLQSLDSIEDRVLNVQHLYNNWSTFSSSRKRGKSSFEPLTMPEFYNQTKKPSCVCQFLTQMRRNALLFMRNSGIKLIDTFIIFAAACLTVYLNGPAELVDADGFGEMIDFRTFKSDVSLEAFLNRRGGYTHSSYRKHMFFYLQIGVTCSTLVALATCKYFSDKRLQQIREFESGYSLAAHYWAAGIASFIEQSFQIALVAVISFLLRGSLIPFTSCLVHFLLMAWFVSSWAILFTVVVPPKNVTVAIGFFTVFTSLCLSGCLKPFVYEDIYSNSAVALICGLFSPTRFFVESMMVSEFRCLPAQYGYIIDSDATDMWLNQTIFNKYSLGVWDVHNVTNQSCTGWFWSVLPCVLVGISVRYTGFTLLYVRPLYGRWKRCSNWEDNLITPAFILKFLQFFLPLGCLYYVTGMALVNDSRKYTY